MLSYSLSQRLRLFIGKIPGAKWVYDFVRTVFSPTYREDGLVTVNNCDFIKTPKFKVAYEAALNQQAGVKIHWRAHVIQWAASHASKLKGDFVECGVNRAFLSMSAMHYINFREMTERKFYLFDTYSGLVPEQVTKEDRAARRNYYSDCYEFVKDSFRDYKNVAIVKGIVPDSLDTVDIDSVAYLSIDMNCVEPEVAALEYFWPKMVSGGVIILDDYGFPGHESQKQAADKFAAEKNVDVLSVPTGQGMILKP